jgi:hypothetical protein
MTMALEKYIEANKGKYPDSTSIKAKNHLDRWFLCSTLLN